jgi:hypothetical protein
MVIMDDLPAHKPARVRELIEERGCELIYLPAYSPELNPIEEAFAKIKGWRMHLIYLTRYGGSYGVSPPRTLGFVRLYLDPRHYDLWRSGRL